MRIAEALNAPGHRGGTAPLVPKILAKMPDELRTLAEQLLASDHSDRFVAEAFSDEDPAYQVSQGAVRSYRQTQRLSRFA